jgi:hypothetical protein
LIVSTQGFKGSSSHCEGEPNGRLLASRVAIVFGCVASLVSLVGCAVRQVHLDEKGMTCTEAQSLAVAAVDKMGYTVKASTKPSATAPGMVTGERVIGTGNIHRVLVQVFCTSIGAEVEAKVEGGAIDNLSFGNDFKEAFKNVATVRRPVRETAQGAVDVLVVPERPSNNQLGVDFTGTGILPVSIRVTNHSPRRYRFKVSGVVLQQADKRRVNALAWSEISGMVLPAAAAGLEAKLVSDVVLSPGDALAGYLYFRFGGYVSARVTLVDIESKEDEGFFIEL